MHKQCRADSQDNGTNIKSEAPQLFSNFTTYFKEMNVNLSGRQVNKIYSNDIISLDCGLFFSNECQFKTVIINPREDIMILFRLPKININTRRLPPTSFYPCCKQCMRSLGLFCLFYKRFLFLLIPTRRVSSEKAVKSQLNSQTIQINEKIVNYLDEH